MISTRPFWSLAKMVLSVFVMISKLKILLWLIRLCDLIGFTGQYAFGWNAIPDSFGHQSASICPRDVRLCITHPKRAPCSLVRTTAPFHSSFCLTIAINWHQLGNTWLIKRESRTWFLWSTWDGFCRAEKINSSATTARKRANV
jgi:hypothetical protein